MMSPEELRPADPAAVRRAVGPVFLFALAGALALLGGIFMGPWAKSHGWERTASFLYGLYSPLCHQIPERSFCFLSFPMTVCGRCLGIYAGFAAGVVLYPFLRGFDRLVLPRARLFLLCTLPLAVDGLAGLVGLWTAPGPLRFVTGLLWGGLLPFYFIPGVASAFFERRGPGRPPGNGNLEKRSGKDIE